MASSIEYLTYVLDCLKDVDVISHKKMMGEFLLYKDGVLFGGVYDDRFLVKKTPNVERFGLEDAIPYEGAKAMCLVDADDSESVKEIVFAVVSDLAGKKK